MKVSLLAEVLIKKKKTFSNFGTHTHKKHSNLSWSMSHNSYKPCKYVNVTHYSEVGCMKVEVIINFSIKVIPSMNN